MPKHKITNFRKFKNSRNGLATCSSCGEVKAVWTNEFGKMVLVCSQRIHSGTQPKGMMFDRGVPIGVGSLRLVAQLCKERANYECEVKVPHRCTGIVEAHHMWSVRHQLLSRDLANLVSFDSLGHDRFHSDPEFKEAVWNWFRQARPEDAAYVEEHANDITHAIDRL